MSVFMVERDLKGISMVGLAPDDPTLTQLFEIVPVLKSFPRISSTSVFYSIPTAAPATH